MGAHGGDVRLFGGGWSGGGGGAGGVTSALANQQLVAAAENVEEEEERGEDGGCDREGEKLHIAADWSRKRLCLCFQDPFRTGKRLKI